MLRWAEILYAELAAVADAVHLNSTDSMLLEHLHRHLHYIFPIHAK